MSALAPSLFDDPSARALVSTGRRPRPYQIEAEEAILAALRAGRSPLAVIAVGLGKTFIAGRVATGFPGRKLFCAHTEELVQQSKDSLERDTGERWELEKGESRASVNGKANVVASIQTIMRPDRFQRFPADTFSLVMLDEVHHYPSKAFRAAPLYFKRGGALLYGMTSTPDRKDGKGYGGMFDVNEDGHAFVAYRKDLLQAIEEGWSTPMVSKPYTAEEIDLTGVAWDKGDFVAGMLDEQIVRSVAPIKQAALEYADDLKTVIFTPGVTSAKVVAGALNLARPWCARSVDGGMDKSERRAVIADFKRGRFQFLTNCMVLTEGFDDETIRCIIDAAPTSSRARAEQKLGRGTRLWPGLGDIHDEAERRAATLLSPKPHVRIIDLAFNSKHALAGPLEVLGHHYSEKERNEARRILKARGGDTAQALATARETVARRAAAAKAASEARVQLRAAKEAAQAAAERRTSSGELALTPGQERKMREFGIPFDNTTTKAKATKLLQKEFFAKKMGWCTYATRVALETKVGIRSAWALPVEKAKRLRDAWAAGGKLQMSQEQINRVLAGAERRYA